ncbi:Bug family tripartite tricarboxylate transporter substrate binding protein [Comamonas sp.]|uniref:Bug family tripartite tricarboxylate transporter substrate binding protein n=1 Tax=Comamonas sp. TaxID=34028 RepID=UPI003A959294
MKQATGLQWSKLYPRVRRAFASVVSVCILGSAGSVAWAQGLVDARHATYPQRPVRLIVPFTPGGSADIIARMVADAMQAPLGQAVIVENRAGASGLIGAEAVAHAAPDGYVIGLGTISTLAVNPVLLAHVSRIDPSKDLAPIVALTSIASVFSVHPRLGVHNFGQFVMLARGKPSLLNIGSSGVGSVGHLIIERLNASLKIRLHHIPYKGQGPVVSSALSGETHVLSDQYPSSAAHVNSGRLIPIAVAAQERLPALPQVPTFKELGHPALNDLAITWFGLVAPAGTPPQIIDKLNTAANAVLNEPVMQERLQAMGVQVLGGSPQQLREMTQEANRSVRDMVKEGLIKLETVRKP